MREAAACWLLLLTTGFSFGLWHPWPEVTWPAPTVPFVVWTAGVVLVVWAVSFAPWSHRIPRWLTIVASIAVLLHFVAYDLGMRVARAQGADNTEAIEIGARALIHLEDPYALSTHTGNPVIALLGGLILSVPLMLLMGSLFLQLTVAWAGGVALAEHVAPRAGFAVAVLISASPWSRGTLPYLNDNGLTPFFVVVAGAWGYRLASRRAGWLPQATWTLLMAFALDYRWTMWAIGIPYGVLFLRRFGLRRTLAWLVPVLVATLVLFAAPILFPSGGYLDRTMTVLFEHTAGPGGTWGSVVPILATLVTLCVSSFFVRSLRDVWAVMSVTLMVLLASLAAFWVPETSVKEAFYRYEFYWYIGWPLVFGIAYLVTPRERPIDGTEAPRPGAADEAATSS
ncbi:hypothetical protein ACS3YM_16320 [Nocardia sp. N13]|uniref:hypothetical protein n=1 Tax=Nocardioides sp. N13(2025) TaxID=3453405 RepID=UPI003F75D3B4